MYFLFFCCISLLNPVQAFSIFLDKRQAIASRTCLFNENNTVSICSPTSSSVWYNDTIYDITWKYNNPLFNAYTDVDLHLLSLSNTGEYESVKNWSSLAKSIGILVPRVDDSWFTTTLQDNSANVSWTMYFYLVGAGYDIQTDLAKIPSSQNQFPPPQSFTLIQNAHNTTTTTATTTTTTTTTNTPDTTTTTQANEDHNTLPSWAIAVICVVSVLFLVALGALFFAMKRYRTKKQAELVTEHNDEKLLVPEVAPVQRPALLGLNSEANQSSSILSSTDALMIADTFRQFMRKPEWNENHDLK
ncbi:unnamed protein product [Rhizopus stolonifer]